MAQKMAQESFHDKGIVKVKEALETGASPGDFPREDYEKSWQDRFTVNDLNIHGKRALGMV